MAYKDFGKAQFITTDFHNYTDPKTGPWFGSDNPFVQHNELLSWAGLPVFICDFDLESTEDCTLKFSALGCIDIYINGKHPYFGEMMPGWSNYNVRALYYSEDISDFVVKGKNRILAVVSTGWYTGRISGGYYGDGTPSVLISLEQNGKQIALTNESWKAKVTGPVKTADIWDGEFADGRKDSYEQMSQTGYDISQWKNAEVFNYKGQVTPFIGSKVTKREGLSLKPESIKLYNGIEYNGTMYGKIKLCSENAAMPFTLSQGVKTIVDFGQETVGRLNIKFRAPEGTRVKMRYAEFLNDSGDIARGNDGPEGSVYTINLRSALAKAYYISGSEDISDYSPKFTFFGYRYVEISADSEIEIIDLTAEVIGNDNIETGKIETSSPIVNRLISNVIWGQRSNYLSVPTDCPQRDERLGWTGDAQAFSVTAGYNADVYGFFRKWMQDMRDSQSENGAYADVNPRVRFCSSDDASGWADAGIIIPYNMYWLFGDKQMLTEHFDSMCRYMDGLVEKYGYAGPIPRYGDWLAYDYCSNEYISSAYFIHDCDIMIFVSNELGFKDKADHFTQMKNKATEHFNKEFMADGVLKEKTQSVKILALAFDLVSDEYKAVIAEELAQQIHHNDDRLSCGFLGTYNLCPALSKHGKDKTAYNLLLQHKEPSWLYSVDQGATTVWERWNSYTKDKGFGDVGMNSFNHYAYGAIVEWMYRYMAGIEPAEPGFTKIKLQPRPDLRKTDELPENEENIKWVKASYLSAKGLIESSWSAENGLEYNCTVPEGTSCTLYLPLIGNKYSLNGSEYTSDKSELVIDLEPGKYEIIQ